MWYLIRPDSLNVLNNPVFVKVFPRYIKVVDNELPAYFQITKRIEAKFNQRDKIEKLWNLHARLMKKFKELKEKIDKSKIKLTDFKIPTTSLLDLKIFLVSEIMKACCLCERKCGVNRWKGKLGVCRVGNRCLISSEFIHLGEEPHITPSHTIFFMGCPFKCQYCQNWAISQWFEEGREVDGRFLAKAIEERRREGARNANFVGGEPIPSLFWILEALNYCKINVPVVWNSDMYMSEKTMEILDGVVDVYLSDFKYGNDKCAVRLSLVSKYFSVVSRNHLLAANQAEITIRHLILPSHVECCTKPVLKWVAQNLKEKCLVNIMNQYTPHWKAHLYPEINKGITAEEFAETANYANSLHLNFIT